MIRRRWIKPATVEWVDQADSIMLESGCVLGTRLYEQRHKARARARRLIELMVGLDLHERWELREHTNRMAGGWQWAVEYVGGRQNGQAG